MGGEHRGGGGGEEKEERQKRETRHFKTVTPGVTEVNFFIVKNVV